MKLNGAEIIIRELKKQGITTVAGIPGGSNLPLYEVLAGSGIVHVLARHEQGAGFIAHGFARTTGKTAVCIATSGPGVTNLLTAIADAKADSIPMVAITGQVNTTLVGTDAFQEVDTYGMTLSITKHNYFVRSAEELARVLPDAFRIANTGRPGPVVVDIPKDILFQTTRVTSVPEQKETYMQEPSYSSHEIGMAVEMIRDSRRPVLCVGGGVIISEASAVAREFASRTSMPVVSTLMGLGIFSESDSNYFGMIGMHGHPAANFAVRDSDLLVGVGMRFDDRATGRVDEFCPNARIIHIDIDASEIGKIFPVTLGLQGDAGKVLSDILSVLGDDSDSWSSHKGWIDSVQAIASEIPMPTPDDESLFYPQNLIRWFSNQLGDNAIITTDVGQHQMWTAQHYNFTRPRRFLTSGGLGTMGFGLPAAIGAALARREAGLPDIPVVCFSGDGSILMNVQELVTLAELDLPVKVIVFNNGSLGLVRQQQQLFYNAIYSASKFEISPNLEMIAQGFGVPAITLQSGDDYVKSLSKIISSPGPSLANVAVAPEENVYPMVSPGAGNTNMLGVRSLTSLRTPAK